ncbi:MAG TPA: GtrA family protein [Paludibacter sp.]
MHIFPKIINRFQQNKLLRFFFVSGLNTFFGYGLFAILVFIGLVYPIALLVATIAGILFNFKTIGIIVFKNHDNLLIFRFFGVYGITYLFNLGGLALLKYFEINIYMAGALLLIPVGLLAFLLNKLFVFN